MLGPLSSAALDVIDTPDQSERDKSRDVTDADCWLRVKLSAIYPAKIRSV